MTESTENELLDQIADFLEAEDLIIIRDESWGRSGGAAVLAHRDGWQTVVSISVETPEDRSTLVCFWVPVLEAVGSDSDGNYPQDDQEMKEIQDKTDREVARLNEDQLIGRWVFRHRMNRVTLEHELSADALTREQVVETVETLGRDSNVWKHLQATLGGISGLQGMKEAAKAHEVIQEARRGTASSD